MLVWDSGVRDCDGEAEGQNLSARICGSVIVNVWLKLPGGAVPQRVWRDRNKLPMGVRHTARLTAAQHKKRERTTPFGVILSMHPEVPSRFELLYTVLQTVA